MSKILSVKYHQERYQGISKEEKKKSNSMVMNFKKISQKMKKTLYNKKKFHITIIRKYFNLENFVSL